MELTRLEGLGLLKRQGNRDFLGSWCWRVTTFKEEAHRRRNHFTLWRTSESVWYSPRRDHGSNTRIPIRKNVPSIRGHLRSKWFSSCKHYEWSRNKDSPNITKYPHWSHASVFSNQATFQWRSGEPLHYTNWGSGQPDIGGGEQKCATNNFFGGDGRWSLLWDSLNVMPNNCSLDDGLPIRSPKLIPVACGNHIPSVYALTYDDANLFVLMKL